MLRWFRNWLDGLRRTDRGRPSRFDPAWEDILEREVEFYLALPSERRARLRDLIARFIAEKRWWGAEGLEVTDEMKVIVAAFACLLVLGSPDLGLYPRTKEVILFPREFGDRVEAVGPDGRRYDVEDLLLGETHYRGPVLLAWNSIKPPLRRSRRRQPPVQRRGGDDRADGAATAEAQPSPPKSEVLRESPAYGDVIIHEFAHAIDSLDGLWDGTPPLGTDEKLRAWARVFDEEYRALVRAAERGRRTFLDPYGAEDPTEFFAVAAEAFFLEADRMRKTHPQLYDMLADFFRLDPAAWTPSAADAGPPPR